VRLLAVSFQPDEEGEAKTVLNSETLFASLDYYYCRVTFHFLNKMNNGDCMTPEQQHLLSAAQDAAQKAYAPYSNFRVGAAVLTDNGVFSGANIENSCTNLGTCAERVALSCARMGGAKAVIGIAVNCIDAPSDSNGRIQEHLAMPCGGCRQWIAELAPQAWIVTNASDKIYTLEDILPAAFTLTR
jgi:cytidine deaminase